MLLEKVALQYLAFGEWDVGIAICDKLLSYYARLEGWWEFTGARINRQIAVEAISNNRGVEDLKQALLNLIKDQSWDICRRVIYKINLMGESVAIQIWSDKIFQVTNLCSIDWDGSVLSFKASTKSKLHSLDSTVVLTFTFEDEEDFLFEGRIFKADECIHSPSSISEAVDNSGDVKEFYQFYVIPFA